MAPRTPRWLEATDHAGIVLREAIDLAAADGRITPRERRFLRDLHRLVVEMRAWNQARLELQYTVAHGIAEPQTPWHARLRRELEQLAERERAEIERLGREVA